MTRREALWEGLIAIGHFGLGVLCAYWHALRHRPEGST